MNFPGAPDEHLASWKIRDITIAPGRILKATPLFETYWRFAAKRQRLFLRRVTGSPPPWTDDPILERYRFTNVYRASDRVSQFVIRHIIYEGDQSPKEVFFRVMLFKLFNRIETWRALVSRVGIPTTDDFHPESYADLFDARLDRGLRVYSAAYIVPSPRLGHHRKHRNHLQLLELMLRDRIFDQIADADSLEAVYSVLRTYPSVGPFLGFQFAIDLNYSSFVDFSEMDFIVAGPGATNGIRRCFAHTAGYSNEDVIRAVSDLRERELHRLGIDFPDLWGRRLQLIDLQNLFCEVDKYARVALPLSPNPSNRTRIKQLFQPSKERLPQWYPPKWRINLPSSVEAEP